MSASSLTHARYHFFGELRIPNLSTGSGELVYSKARRNAVLRSDGKRYWDRAAGDTNLKPSHFTFVDLLVQPKTRCRLGCWEALPAKLRSSLITISRLPVLSSLGLWLRKGRLPSHKARSKKGRHWQPISNSQTQLHMKPNDMAGFSPTANVTWLSKTRAYFESRMHCLGWT